MSPSRNIRGRALLRDFKHVDLNLVSSGVPCLVLGLSFKESKELMGWTMLPEPAGMHACNVALLSGANAVGPRRGMANTAVLLTSGIRRTRFYFALSRSHTAVSPALCFEHDRQRQHGH